jgi:hypothetical protein
MREAYPTDEPDDTNYRNFVLADEYRDRYKLRVLNVGRAMKRHNLAGSKDLLWVADSPLNAYQILCISNGLKKLATELGQVQTRVYFRGELILRG